MDPAQFGLSKTDFELLLSAIKDFPSVKKVTLFGSRAKGNYKPGSDVDLVVDTVGDNLRVAVDLANRLNEETPLPYMFDVIDRRSINEQALLDHIERVGVVIYQ